jgi:triacylglycerol lipase
MRTRRLTAGIAAVAVLLSIVFSASSAQAHEPADPVIIVPGIAVGPLDEFVYHPLRDRLRKAGYTVEILTKPKYGLDGVAPNAELLEHLVDDVLAETGARKVDLIGHSQGGLVVRHYVEYLGGHDNVDVLMTLGSPHQGTLAANIANFLALGNCLAIVGCQEMTTDSDYLKALNAGDDTIGDVRYVLFATKYDELAVPYTTGFLDPDDGNVTNIKVQDQCRFNLVGHLGLILNGPVADGVLDALRDEPVRMNCLAR